MKKTRSVSRPPAQRGSCPTLNLADFSPAALAKFVTIGSTLVSDDEIRILIGVHKPDEDRFSPYTAEENELSNRLRVLVGAFDGDDGRLKGEPPNRCVTLQLDGASVLLRSAELEARRFEGASLLLGGLLRIDDYTALLSAIQRQAQPGRTLPANGGRGTRRDWFVVADQVVQLRRENPGLAQTKVALQLEFNRREFSRIALLKEAWHAGHAQVGERGEELRSKARRVERRSSDGDR